MQTLHDRGGLAGQQLLNYKKKHQDALLECQSGRWRIKRSREAEGLIAYERELAQREKDLADAKAALTMLEAGTRHEDIDAEQAHLRRLEEELNHFLHQQEKQSVVCPVAGTIITPRFKEQIGLFVERGTPLCVIEDLQNLGSGDLGLRKRRQGPGQRTTDYVETEITCTDDTDSDRRSNCTGSTVRHCGSAG